MIYNDGDIQFAEGGSGVYAGPAACYSKQTILQTAAPDLPCFDGGNHFTAASVTSAGEPPGMWLLQLTANFNSYDIGAGATTTGNMPFAFAR